MTSNEDTKGLTSNTIKIIAIIAMTIDHSATILFPRFSLDIPVVLMHIIGRLTAPIMMFLIVEGYYHTRNIKKYIFRLFILAIISHFAYAFAFDKDFKTVFDQTSVIWAYMLGLIALVIRESDTLKMWQKNIILFPVILAAFPADWSSPAVFAVLYMGLNHGNFKKQMISLVICIAVYSAVYAIFLNVVYGIMQMLIVLAIPILYRYNGQRGKWKGMKWLFYVYYPLHLIILGLIRVFILHKGIN
ncbi:MAG: conjugal transfer protein TraX [Treponema sp.]|nr:conjugal transfer protein TraX [Treponema sp.]